MTSLWQAPAIVVVLTWLGMAPSTLADAARQEALRRSAMPKSVGSFTNLDWPPAAVGPEPVTLAPAPVVAPAVTRPSVASAADEAKRDEAWWQARMAGARALLERNQTLAEAVQSHVNRLRAEATNRDDPAQQALFRQQLGRALAELDRLHAQIAADRQLIAVIQDDARRQGVPPGWIR